MPSDHDAAQASDTILRDASIFVTGGTGSFGREFVRTVLRERSPRRVVIFSRDELKQSEFAAELGSDRRVRFFIGDVRDESRLWRALDGMGWPSVSLPDRPS